LRFIWPDTQVNAVVPVERVVLWLNDNGFYCDCEALANAEEAWRHAIGDVDW
jgi:hypothetical protein